MGGGLLETHSDALRGPGGPGGGPFLVGAALRERLPQVPTCCRSHCFRTSVRPKWESFRRDCGHRFPQGTKHEWILPHGLLCTGWGLLELHPSQKTDEASDFNCAVLVDVISLSELHWCRVCLSQGEDILTAFERSGSGRNRSAPWPKMLTAEGL